MTRPFELELLSDAEVGGGGFLHVRRLRLRNLRPDGSRSAEYVCDFVERKKGLDAVVVVVYRRDERGGVEVLLRDGLRPALLYGRPPGRAPLPEPRERFLLTEVVAGIVEEGEVGETALRQRAAAEVWEEAGLRVRPEALELLGGSFPSAGMTAERFWFVAAEVAPDAATTTPEGDGSPMEEGAWVRWVPLSEALAQCARGELEDAKTEIALCRLSGRLAGS